LLSKAKWQIEATSAAFSTLQDSLIWLATFVVVLTMHSHLGNFSAFVWGKPRFNVRKSRQSLVLPWLWSFFSPLIARNITSDIAGFGLRLQLCIASIHRGNFNGAEHQQPSCCISPQN
jgi:hypothetical protein